MPFELSPWDLALLVVLVPVSRGMLKCVIMTHIKANNNTLCNIDPTLFMSPRRRRLQLPLILYII